MPTPSPVAGPERAPPRRPMPTQRRWHRWWGGLGQARQDRLSYLAPLLAVIVFLAAIVAVFGYLRLEEADRELQGLKRDVEYAHQQLRLRLLERQDQILRMSRQVASAEFDAKSFALRADALIDQYPELSVLTWLDTQGRVIASRGSPMLQQGQVRLPDELLPVGPTRSSLLLATRSQQTLYSLPAPPHGLPPMLELHVPFSHTLDSGVLEPQGVLLAEYSLDNLLHASVMADIWSRYSVSLVDAQGDFLAGSPAAQKNRAAELLPSLARFSSYEVPVSPVGSRLTLRAQVWRTSLGLVGNGMFWVGCALAAFTIWLLLVSWRHTRHRFQAQRALLAETNFRRAVENSMPTGLRAIDLAGRITYVNAAFMQMTGWSEAELVGRTPPYPYWPSADLAALHASQAEELEGRTPASGVQMRVKRRNGTLFDARVLVAPLIDANGIQTGWMSSLTDVTEPNRIREQLSASHERFTTVLEALDAAVSVAPLGNRELLFANKTYLHWFGHDTHGHSQLVMQAGSIERSDEGDFVDSLAGLPMDALTGETAHSESCEIFVEGLSRWLEVRARYLTWVDGRLAQMVIATDITPRRKAEQTAALQAAKAQASSRLITMGEMASTVAHELNQPLTAINNYCSGMVTRVQNQAINNDDLIAALEKTAKQAQRAGHIIQRIRSFVKRSEPNRAPADVAAMVSEALELAGFELRRRNVRLSHYLAARLPALWVDRLLIEQVLVNLIKNAAESVDSAQRPSGQRAVELRVVPKVTEQQPGVEFSVTDTGPGLAPEVMSRLFEAFYSTKSEGLGIGLSLCRSIVESHHGRMQAENLYNGSAVAGCRFSFWLPLGNTPLQPRRAAALESSP